MLYSTTSCSANKDERDKNAGREPVSTKTSKEEKSNGVFEILSFSNDSVQFKAVKEIKFYAIALMSDSEILDAKSFSNSVGTVKWANGSQFRAGSTMGMPATFGVGAMTLPEGVVLTVFRFDAPDSFKATKIKFVTEGTTEMYYNIQKSSWNE